MKRADQSMDQRDREHLAWLGRCEQRGILLTVPVLDAAEANLTRPIDDVRGAWGRHLAREAHDGLNIRGLLGDVLGWSVDFVVSLGPSADDPDAGDLGLSSADGGGEIVLLVRATPRGTELDIASGPRLTPQQRFEQRLRELGIPTGLLTNGQVFRIVHAAPHESPAWISFSLGALLDDADDETLGAFHMLLNERRLLSLPPDRRLASLIEQSRAYRISSLGLENIGAFAAIELSFVKGLNVFIGANGVGKSHAMKALYAAIKPFERLDESLPIEARLRSKLARVFLPDEGQVGRLVRREDDADEGRITVRGPVGHIALTLHATGEAALTLESSSWQSAAPALYFPTRDVLAMFEGFIAAYTQRAISFDETFYDACVALSALPLLGARKDEAAALAAPIEAALGGAVSLRGGRFYLGSGKGALEAHLMAEGLRKVASLAHLIANGSLVPGGIFFWDEPEASLNPRLVTMAADLLIELAAQGVQIFVTTHDYLLAHRLSLAAEYKTRPDVTMKFFGFYRPEPGAPVLVEEGDTLAGIAHNPILDEFTRHADHERSLFYAQAPEAPEETES